MTNSNRVTPSTTIGTEDPITPDTDKFISNRGTEFQVKVLPNGLFYIHMAAGGATPTLCDELFTSRSGAETALTRYIVSRAKPTGEAQIPKRMKNAKS